MERQDFTGHLRAAREGGDPDAVQPLVERLGRHVQQGGKEQRKQGPGARGGQYW